MDENEMIDSIGLPLKDSKVIEWLKQTKSNMPTKGHHAPNVFNLDKGLVFSFRSRCAFERNYLEPPYLTLDMPHPHIPFENPDDVVCELMLERIWFDNKYDGALPYKLKFDDENSDFIKQGKPYKKIKYTKGTYGSCFVRDRYELQLQFDKDNKLLRILISLVENNTRRLLRRKETIKEQNKNIDPEFLDNVLSYKNLKLSKQWTARMKGGDDCFSQESIDETIIILDGFIDQLAVATSDKKASKILSAVKKVVVALNKLNTKYNHIETMEREELCEFIHSSLKSTGYILEQNEDITEEWREW